MYAFIHEQVTANELSTKTSLNLWCGMPDVSRSYFYDWQARRGHVEADTTALEMAARAAHARGRERYGALRLRTELATMGFG
jgi:hypothetical protein